METGSQNFPTVSPGNGTQRIRVLVVDDSVVARRMITNALEGSSDIETVGTAPNAERALEKISALKPDLVTLDIYMPGMSGLDLIPILRDQHPDLRVLIFSGALTSSAGALETLKLTPRNYLPKPSEDIALAAYLPQLGSDLATKIRQIMTVSSGPDCAIAKRLESPRKAEPLPVPASLWPVAPAYKATSQRTEYHILAIGVSTGGPTALAKLLASLPSAFSLPLVIVQHMPPVFTSLLANRLRTQTGFHVVEGASGMLVEPGKAILAPGGYHMRLRRSGNQVMVTLDQGEQECSCRPSVDVLFRSVAEVYGRSAIGAVLTGMGQDGLKGAGEMKKAGSYVMVQDEASSVVWGMPGAISNAGLADEVVDIGLMAKAIVKKVGHSL